MRGSVGLGLGIAALFAGGVLVVSVFGNHDGWFLRAARQNAVRCLTKEPCTELSGSVVVTNARPPLSTASPCAKPEGWTDPKATGGGNPAILVVCRDGGKTYLYHMGTLTGRDAGQEQWVACAEAKCDGEINGIVKRMSP